MHSLREFVNEVFKILKLNSVEYEGAHPTEKGTADIINQLNNSFNNEIILAEAEAEDTED